jgi:uncharacterized protein YdaU (DUF1376 family)
VGVALSAPYYRFFVGDYLRDAGHLSLLEHGAYRRLIDLYMSGGGPLPFDMPRLYRLLHATSKEEQAAVQVVVEEFFRMDGGCLRHKRCDREIQYSLSVHLGAKANAEVRWSRHRKKNELENKELYTDAMPPHYDRNANQNQIKDKDKDLVLIPHFVASSAITEIRAPCPLAELIALYNRICTGCRKFQVRNAERDGHIRARWRQIFEQRAVTTPDEAVAFFGDFFIRVQNSAFLTGRIAGNGHKPFQASLDWLTNPQNFAKVIEGKYDS